MIDLEKNLIACCDNLELLKLIPDQSIDMIYIDPPYFSQKKHFVENRRDAKSTNPARQVRKSKYEFEDIFESLESYLDFMDLRLVEAHRVLKESGSLFVHLDYRMVHYVKVELDKVFGRSSFKNQITWKKNYPKGARSVASHFGRQTDEILFYVKNPKRSNFFKTYRPIDLTAKNNKFRFKDKNGRIYSRDCPLGDYSKKSIAKFEKEGRIYTTKNGKKQLIRYLDEVKGMPLTDLWDDISPLNQIAKERLGYPTQKPLALLERIIESCTKEGDIVLDFFGGSGTTAKVAFDKRRKFITCDVLKDSFELMCKRLKDAGCLDFKSLSLQ